jgi:hypothetical protein
MSSKSSVSRIRMHRSICLTICLVVHFQAVDIIPFVQSWTATKSIAATNRRKHKGATTMSHEQTRTQHPSRNSFNSGVIVVPLRMSTMKQEPSDTDSATSSATTRRKWIQIGLSTVMTTSSLMVLNSQPALAKPDCYTDCYKNCKALAPKDDAYCKESCTDYCTQEDRQDGLSGSISSEKGEVGILGGSFGTGTVVKGQDKPPTLGRIPGLDFTSESGKKLIGY